MMVQLQVVMQNGSNVGKQSKKNNNEDAFHLWFFFVFVFLECSVYA